MKVEKGDIISLQDARSSARSLEHLGYALKNLSGARLVAISHKVVSYWVGYSL